MTAPEPKSDTEEVPVCTSIGCPLPFMEPCRRGPDCGVGQ